MRERCQDNSWDCLWLACPQRVVPGRYGMIQAVDVFVCT